MDGDGLAQPVGLLDRGSHLLTAEELVADQSPVAAMVGPHLDEVDPFFHLLADLLANLVGAVRGAWPSRLFGQTLPQPVPGNEQPGSSRCSSLDRVAQLEVDALLAALVDRRGHARAQCGERVALG